MPDDAPEPAVPDPAALVPNLDDGVPLVTLDDTAAEPWDAVTDHSGAAEPVWLDGEHEEPGS
jgi:hypothetical protein